jgi:hypothetical protein
VTGPQQPRCLPAPRLHLFIGRIQFQGNTEYKLLVVRVETDGRATSVVEAQPGELTGWGSLVAGAPDLRVVYSGFNSTDLERAIYWRRLDSSGMGTAPRVALGWDVGYSLGRSLAVAVGGDSVILLSDFSTRASIVRVTAAGEIATPVFDIAAAPGFYKFAMARRGSDVVIGWLAPLGLGLARIAP